MCRACPKHCCSQTLALPGDVSLAWSLRDILKWVGYPSSAMMSPSLPLNPWILLEDGKPLLLPAWIGPGVLLMDPTTEEWDQATSLINCPSDQNDWTNCISRSGFVSSLKSTRSISKVMHNKRLWDKVKTSSRYLYSEVRGVVCIHSSCGRHPSLTNLSIW